MGDSWKETEMDASQNYSGKTYEADKLLPNNILEFVKDTKRVHPTQKPVQLLEYLIKTYTNEDDLVLDNCAGSGSTLIAARNLNRNFIGIEQNEEYFDITNQRLKEVLI